QRQPHAHHHGHARRQRARRLHAERGPREPDGHPRRIHELRRHDQPDRRLHRPSHPERERPAQWRHRRLHAQPGHHVLHPLGEHEPEHADRDLHAHHHRGQRQPHAHHHGHARRQRARRLHARSEAHTSELQPRGHLVLPFHRPGHHGRLLPLPTRRSSDLPAQWRHRRLHAQPGHHVLHPLGEHEPEHADRDLHAHHHRGQRQPHAHHHGHARRQRARRLHA